MITIKIRCHQPLDQEFPICILNEIEAFVFDQLPNPTTVAVQSKKEEIPIIGRLVPGSLNFTFIYEGAPYFVTALTGRSDSGITLAQGVMVRTATGQSPEEVWAGDDGPAPFPSNHEDEPGKFPWNHGERADSKKPMGPDIEDSE